MKFKNVKPPKNGLSLHIYKNIRISPPPRDQMFQHMRLWYLRILPNTMLSGARCIMFDLRLYLPQNFMHASSKGSSATARMCRLVCAFTVPSMITYGIHARIQKVFAEGVQLLLRVLVDNGREDPNTTKRGTPSTRQRNAI